MTSSSIKARIACLLGWHWLLGPVAVSAEVPSGRYDVPMRYTVRFGAMLGTVEPVAGSIVCDVGRDCAILLSIGPKIEIRLQSSSDAWAEGTATVDCPSIDCRFANKQKSIRYSKAPNDLNLYDGLDRDRGISISPVFRPKRKLGQFSFAVESQNRSIDTLPRPIRP